MIADYQLSATDIHLAGQDTATKTAGTERTLEDILRALGHDAETGAADFAWRIQHFTDDF